MSVILFWLFSLAMLVHLEFLSLKGDCTGSFESTLVKMPRYWKSHVATHLVALISLCAVEQREVAHTWVCQYVNFELKEGPAPLIRNFADIYTQRQ